MDPALVLLHDVRGNPQPNPRTLRALGGKKRIVDMLLGLRGDPLPRVRNRHPNAMFIAAPIRAWPHPDCDLTTLAHRFDRIADQIHKDLANLARETLEFRRVIRSQIDIDVCFPEFSLEQRQHRAHQNDDIRRGRDHRLSVKLEPLRSDLRNAEKLLVRLL